MANKKIKRALISVFDKSGIAPIVKELDRQGVEILSTGGTQKHIEELGIQVHAVEELTDYPSILGGRVKTLHPKVFGGILAMRNDQHQGELEKYDIPEIDLVVVDLYPFEETLTSGGTHEEIIEKIDIGGISLIRAAAKNFKDVLVIPSRELYGTLLELLKDGKGSDEGLRRQMAATAFKISSQYDFLIADYLNAGDKMAFTYTASPQKALRYGENPHQSGEFYGNLQESFKKIQGKALSYNNLNDIESAIRVIADMPEGKASCAVIKHTNTCGLAVRDNVYEAWKAALAGDPVSAFGGIIIFNTEVPENVAREINKMFYEVLIAPSFSAEALEILSRKKKRTLLKFKSFPRTTRMFKSVLNGVLVQDIDNKIVAVSDLEYVTEEKPSGEEIENMLFADICVKHLKSNAIALVKDMQLIGIGTGQTSRVDALMQAIDKAGRMGFETEGAVMASDAFFPFPDCVEIAHKHGIDLVIQPGGSIKDKESIEYCDEHRMKMVLTGTRHFKHG